MDTGKRTHNRIAHHLDGLPSNGTYVTNDPPDDEPKKRMHDMLRNTFWIIAGMVLLRIIGGALRELERSSSLAPDRS